VEASPQQRARMERAYLSGLPLLTSSKAVEEMLRQVGVVDIRPCVHGVDVERYRSHVPPSSRSLRIGFPVRTESVKSPEVLQATLEILREQSRPGMRLWGYGRPDAPASIVGLLDEFHANPDDTLLASLYSGSAIFGVPSRKEGFGMPAAEAMAAGCAVVSTDNGGIHTFGHDGVDCRIVPANDPRELATAILDLVDDPVRRNFLAGNAAGSVDFLSWELAGKRLVSALGMDLPPAT
ncbi:MAG TPA: glycosyltransferase, partial [Fibrobacteria bacterium]|nr:glycosyltransferase [Fibrobacteria bacterium]